MNKLIMTSLLCLLGTISAYSFATEDEQKSDMVEAVEQSVDDGVEKTKEVVDEGMDKMEDMTDDMKTEMEEGMDQTAEVKECMEAGKTMQECTSE
ncbi:hypothetical protein [Vibrio hepatarius]|uniref:hypothetical protein n=1 Tax=Vibrio hepatarius TaxID=171383 RepID=UPI00142E6D80|nr:hypothetical protein [Vibrio hepatarius]NIY82498.1 hypothetical protein [Vibrio hepatarius]